LLHKIQQDGPSDIVQDIFVEMHNKHVAYNLALKALEASEGRFSFEELRGYTQEHLNAATPLAGPSMEHVTHDLDALLNGTIKTQGLRWRLTAMNQMLVPPSSINFALDSSGKALSSVSVHPRVAW